MGNPGEAKYGFTKEQLLAGSLEPGCAALWQKA